MKKEVVIVLIIMALSWVNLVSAEVQSLPTQKQGTCITIEQTCADCTYVNFDSIKYPNSTREEINTAMVQSASTYAYTYSFCETNLLGKYIVTTCGDPATVVTCVDYDFEVTNDGTNSSSSNGTAILGQLGLIGLFLAIAFSFSREKWKMRSLFFMASLLMGIILLNSIRLMFGFSQNLMTMGNIGLLLGIVILTIMFLFLLVNYIIEVFSYFKEKKRMRWQVKSIY